MELLTELLELRGLKNAQGKSGNVYYILNCETVKNGDPIQFYCPDAKALPDGLSKGDKIDMVLSYSPRFKNLVVKQVNRAQTK